MVWWYGTLHGGMCGQGPIGVGQRAGLTWPMPQSKHLSLCLHTRDLFQPAVVMMLQPQATHCNCWPHPHAVLHYPQTFLQSSQQFHPYPIIHPELYKVTSQLILMAYTENDYYIALDQLPKINDDITFTETAIQYFDENGKPDLASRYRRALTALELERDYHAGIIEEWESKI